LGLLQGARRYSGRQGVPAAQRIQVSVGETISRGAGPASAADVTLCRTVWLSALGAVAPEAEQMLARNECYFTLLLLLEEMAGRPLDRWRIAFTENGSAYCS